MDGYRQGGTTFDGFLYASVGNDRNGNAVTVLSTLARLGVDPWDEAAELSALTRDDARTRLGALLARFHDVPDLVREHGPITARLLDLLPRSSGRQAVRASALATPAISSRMGPILAVLVVILVLIQTFLIGSDGTGE